MGKWFCSVFFIDSIQSNSNVVAPKSLREWHEQPVNLSEQPPLSEKVNVQILSPNTDRVNKSIYPYFRILNLFVFVLKYF